MPPRRVLVLSTQHLLAYDWEAGRVRLERCFSLDEAGHTEFRDWLALYPTALMHLLVDLPDEAFLHEVLPYVRGGDRSSLLTRKLNQHFFNTPYRLVRSLGREKQGRRDEHFLFAALSRPQALELCVNALHEAQVAIAGIHSPALLLPALLERKAASEAHLILITLGNGGLRQSYFAHGQLRLSRLKPLTTDLLEEAAVNAYGEAVRIYQYLIGQRLITRGNKIPVVWLANPQHHALLRQTCADTNELSFSFRDLQALAEAKQLKSTSSDSRIDPLLVHMLARHTQTQQFGDKEVRLNYRRWQWRNVINQASIITLTVTLLLMCAAGISILLDQQRSTNAAEAHLQAQQRYQTLVQSLPAISLSPDQLRNLITQWQRLETDSPQLIKSLATLSHALQQHPQIELIALDWRLAANPDDGMPGPDANTWLIMDIEARLPSQLGANRRAQNEIVEHFAHTLRQDAEDNVRILQQPFDTDSAKSLKGSSEAYAGRETLRFSVRHWHKAIS